MTDRAVVDERVAFVEKHPEAGLGFALDEAIPVLKQQAIEEYKASQPRATSALSEDGQWLVTHDPPGDMSVRPEGGWVLWSRNGPYQWGFFNHMSDTGQDAHEMLREFLATKEN